MGFYYEDAKKEAASKPRRQGGTIPIASLNRMGCQVCPRDKDITLEAPKMPPEGHSRPTVYFLALRPTRPEDEAQRSWSGIAARAILSKFSSRFLDRARFGHALQCAPEDAEGHKHPGEAETECCRGRATSDIEESRPLVVVGIGEETLHWATGLKGAVAYRGTPIAARFGRWACWYYPLTYPNWTTNKRRSKSEYEWAMERDAQELERLVEDPLRRDVSMIQDAPYDDGIELITGHEPGDMVRLEEALHRLIRSQAPHGLDVETSGLRPHLERSPMILTAAVGTFHDGVVAFPVDHPDGWGTEGRIARVRGAFGEYLAQSGRKRCHNVGFEQEWCAYFYGEQLLRRTEWDDTMAMAWSQDMRPGTKSLDDQCVVNFGFSLKAQSRVDVSRPRWWELYPIRETLRYNGLDSKWTDLLAEVKLREVMADPRTAALYERRVALAPTLVLMASQGLPVDFSYAKELHDSYDRRCAALEDQCRRTPEVREFTRRFGTFAITNNDHVLKLYREVLRRPEIEVEDWEGNIKFKVDEDTLSLMPADEVPSARMVLDHRGIERNNSTYLGPLLEGKITGPDRQIHYEYSSMHTVTGRLNSKAHNWPKHKHIEVRGVIAAEEPHWIVAADYGQIEFRVAGMLSGDDKIVEYCWTKYDVHKYWAERMAAEFGGIKDWIAEEFSVDWDEAGIKTLRQVAKNNWVFPQLFGAGWESCARNCHLPQGVAQDLAEEFWDEFKGHKRWQQDLVRSYHRHLYVETLGGFRRQGPMTENELINAPIQGTAADIILEGMTAVSERAELEDDREIQPAFNGHDDLTFLISDGRLERSVDIIAEEMCKPRFGWINCPLVVEVSVGSRWDQLKEIRKYSSEQIYNLANPYR